MAEINDAHAFRNLPPHDPQWNTPIPRELLEAADIEVYACEQEVAGAQGPSDVLYNIPADAALAPVPGPPSNGEAGRQAADIVLNYEPTTSTLGTSLANSLADLPAPALAPRDDPLPPLPSAEKQLTAAIEGRTAPAPPIKEKDQRADGSVVAASAIQMATVEAELLAAQNNTEPPESDAPKESLQSAKDSGEPAEEADEADDSDSSGSGDGQGGGDEPGNINGDEGYAEGRGELHELVAGSFDPEEGLQLAKAFLAGHEVPEAPYQQQDPIEVSPLESGSQNNAFRVQTPTGMDLVFRIPKPVPTAPTRRGAGLVREWDTLQRIPPGTAAPYVVLDNTNALLPFPYMVESYIPGEAGSEAVWDNDLLGILGRKLGDAHRSVTSPLATMLGESMERVDLRHEFGLRINSTVASLRTPASRALAEEIQNAILPYLAAHQALFDPIHSFQLLHHDLLPSNIRVTSDNVFIRDWEFSVFGDGAHDLSQFYDLAAPSLHGQWRVLLHEDQESTLIDAYQSTVGPDPTLKQRVHTWQQFEKAAVALYIMSELDNPGSTHMQRFGAVALGEERDLLIGTLDLQA